MTKSENEFTSAHVKQLITGVLKHYKKRIKEDASIDPSILYSELNQALVALIETPGGSLNHLEVSQKRKAYHALNVVFGSLPIYRQLPVYSEMYKTLSALVEAPKDSMNYGEVSQKKKAYGALELFFQSLPRPLNSHLYADKSLALVQNTSDSTIPNAFDFSESTSPVFNWLLLNSLLHLGDHVVNEKHDKPYNRALILSMIVYTILTGVLFPVVSLAFYYLLRETFNSLERLWHNEGTLKPFLQLTGAFSFVWIGTIYIQHYYEFFLPLALYMSLPATLIVPYLSINLALTLIFIAAAAPSVFFASTANLASNTLYDTIDLKISKNSIDPTDSTRYRLTTDDKNNLKAKSIDPLAVECAIIAIRAQIANALGSNEESTPSLFSRLFQHPEVQVFLNQIRQLRRGEITEITVGELHFDCKRNARADLDDELQCHAVLKGNSIN